MRKLSDFISPILLVYSMFCHGAGSSDEAKIKSSLVEEIVQKVCNLSTTEFANRSSDEKTKLLTKIEEKLTKSAQTLGTNQDKYVKLIMKGLKLKAFGNNGDIESDIIYENDSKDVNNDASETFDDKSDKKDDVNQDSLDNSGQRTAFDDRNEAGYESVIATELRAIKEKKILKELGKYTVKPDSLKNKTEIINDIFSKIKVMANKYLKHAKTQVVREKAIGLIKNKFEEMAEHKHVLMNYNEDEIKNYVNLIVKGIDLMLNSNINSNGTRRMELELTNKSNKHNHKDNNENSDQKIDPPYNQNIHRDTSFVTKNRKTVVSKVNPYKYIETKCENFVVHVCTKIKLLKKYTCQKDGNKIEITMVCDGKQDCTDKSDEVDCTRQAMASIHNSSDLMSVVNSFLSRDCFSRLLGDDNIITKQKKTLEHALNKQLNFIQAYSDNIAKAPSRKQFEADTQMLKKASNDVQIVVGSLSSALEVSLCSDLPKDISRKLSSILDKKDTKTLNETINSTPYCKCNEAVCSNKCSPGCKQICWEQYSLSQWLCQAVSGDKSVPIDMICDGKLDCYDETDESGCSDDVSLDKFAATETYNFILKMILTKASSAEFELVRNKLLSLHDVVVKLQKLGVKRYADVLEVKRVRERCFSHLTSIYNRAVRLYAPKQLNEIYGFLMSVNEKLINAMKRSNTGNNKIISPDGCICRDYRCVMPRCTKTCNRACTAEPKLTRYFCKGSTSLNDSLVLDAVCNKEIDCPEGDDEKNCNEEVCRKHHLVMLRLNLRDVGVSHKGTSLGEALISWKTKATSTLLMTEKSHRPTPRTIRNTVRDILHDLVMTFATVDDSRRTGTGPVFSEFYKWSQIVINTLRSCGQ